MTRQFFKYSLKMLAIIFFISASISCNPNNKGENKESTNMISENEAIPDTVVRFLITSAANDFRNHQPPTPVDSRNVKIGYIKSTNNKDIYPMW